MYATKRAVAMKTKIKPLYLSLTILGISLVLAGSCKKEDEKPLSFDLETINALEEVVMSNMIFHGYEIPGIIAGIWTPDKGSWIQAFGYARLDPPIAMTVDKGFRMASVTKTLTATAILQMVEEGYFSLYETINNLGFTDVQNADMITVKQLLNMTSGLPDYIHNEDFIDAFLNNPTMVWTPQELIDLTMGQPVSFQPGEDYQYCNTNYILLGMIIEEVSGSSYESIIEENVTEPLGISHTFFPEGPYLDEGFCSGYSINHEMNIFDGTVMDPSFAWAAGGMVSNLEDLVVWGKELGEGTLLSAQMQHERMVWNGFMGESNPYIKYGLGGWWYSDNFYGHTGRALGYTNAVYYMPATGTVFVIMANADYADIDNIFQEISTVLYPEYVEW